MDKEFIGVDLHSTQITVYRIIVGERGKIERKKGQYPINTLHRVAAPRLRRLRRGRLRVSYADTDDRRGRCPRLRCEPL